MEFCQQHDILISTSLDGTKDVHNANRPKAGIDYIIRLNAQGIEFMEYFAATILAKMFTSRDPGYVDLMSPSGIGIAAVVYNYDGSVYASDESRMLAEVRDHRWKKAGGKPLFEDRSPKAAKGLRILREPVTLPSAFCAANCC